MPLRCFGLVQLLFVLFVSTPFAQDKIPLLNNILMENLSGCLELNTIINRSTNNFNAIFDIDNHIDREDLSSEADPYYYPTIQLLFSVNYTFKNGIQAYVSTPFLNERREGLSFGIFKEFTETSTLDMYLFTNGTFVWENPYDYEKDRGQTFALLSGFAIRLQDIASTGICFDYKLCNIHIKNRDDKIGYNINDLKRDGYIHALGIGYTFYLNRNNNITPTIYYIRGDIEGKSNRYNGYATELSYKKETKKYSFTIKSLYENNKYTKIHPEVFSDASQPSSQTFFSRKRDESILTTEISFTWFDLPGFKNWYARCGAGYIKTDSKINFFDEDTSYIGLAAGYFFG